MRPNVTDCSPLSTESRMKGTEKRPSSDTSAFEALQGVLRVSLIATPRARLEKCRPEESIAAVQRRNTKGYDFLPVVQGDGEDAAIVGLFHAKSFQGTPSVDGIVRHKMHNLSDANLIGADASILDFLSEVSSRPFRLLVSGRRIDGLVSWSDLQKLPVRAALFGLITGLEIVMSAAIRSKYPTGDDWLSHLSNGRRTKVWKKFESSRENDSEVDALLFTEISDKATIIRKSWDLGESQKQLKEHFKRIRKLRDKLAHANDYATTLDDAIGVCRTVRKLLELQRTISKQMDA